MNFTLISALSNLKDLLFDCLQNIPGPMWQSILLVLAVFLELKNGLVYKERVRELYS